MIGKMYLTQLERTIFDWGLALSTVSFIFIVLTYFLLHSRIFRHSTRGSQFHRIAFIILVSLTLLNLYTFPFFRIFLSAEVEKGILTDGPSGGGGENVVCVMMTSTKVFFDNAQSWWTLSISFNIWVMSWGGVGLRLKRHFPLVSVFFTIAVSITLTLILVFNRGSIAKLGNQCWIGDNDPWLRYLVGYNSSTLSTVINAALLLSVVFNLRRSQQHHPRYEPTWAPFRLHVHYCAGPQSEVASQRARTNARPWSSRADSGSSTAAGQCASYVNAKAITRRYTAFIFLFVTVASVRLYFLGRMLCLDDPLPVRLLHHVVSSTTIFWMAIVFAYTSGISGAYSKWISWRLATRSENQGRKRENCQDRMRNEREKNHGDQGEASPPNRGEPIPRDGPGTPVAYDVRDTVVTGMETSKAQGRQASEKAVYASDCSPSAGTHRCFPEPPPEMPARSVVRSSSYGYLSNQRL